MGYFDLANMIIDRQHRSNLEDEKFDIRNAPEIIMSKHPSIYKFHGVLYHEHHRINMNDKAYIYHLIDMPDAKINKSQSVWLYNRLVEMAPDFSDRFILVSATHLWDRKTSELVPATAFEFVTMTDKTSKRLRREENDRKSSARRMGQTD